jgi:hypothetical protein
MNLKHLFVAVPALLILGSSRQTPVKPSPTQASSLALMISGTRRRSIRATS